MAENNTQFPLVKACISHEVNTEDAEGEKVVRILFERASLEIKKGEVIVLHGDSGCGKSTLIKIVGGLIHPLRGFVAWENRLICNRTQNCKTGMDECRQCSDTLSPLEKTYKAPVDKLRGEKITFIFQDHNLISHFTVKENIELGLVIQGEKSKESIDELTEKFMKMVGLLNRKDDKVDNLSGGEKQRVNFARAFAASPALILADEPFSHLDEGNIKKIWKALCDYKRENPDIAIVLISHEAKEILLEKGPYRSDYPIVTHHISISEKDVVKNELKRERIQSPATRNLEPVSGSCPRCNPQNDATSGRDFTQREIGPVKIDICNQCGGAWFDNGEIERLWLEMGKFGFEAARQKLLNFFK